MTKDILVAVAWPYANGRLHLGRVVGCLLPADIFARYHRLLGNNVLMISGSDTHGTPITLAADRAGVRPEVIYGEAHQSFLESQRDLGISFDLFTHTDTENHSRVSQDFFCRLYQKGLITPKTQKLLYSETNGRFLPDRYVEGTCPHCGFADARGDQCDQCGQVLDALELIDPRSSLDGSRPSVRETEHLFLDLPAFSKQLTAYYDSHANHWRPHVLNFSRRYVQDGLQARPISRDLDWGIPVPLPGWEEKKLYIWFENIIGYLSASIEWANNQGNPSAWEKWWYDPQAESYYFLGKDNIPFHTINWPIWLLGAERLYSSDEQVQFNLPTDVPANNFLALEGKQFSTSRNWAVWLPDLLRRYDPDQIRYYLTAVMPENSDTDFTWQGFVDRNNQELLATWGNLVNRVLKFGYKHWGEVPDPGQLRPADNALLDQIEAGFETVGSLIGTIKLRAALHETLALARLVNRYLEESPWFAVVREDKAAAAKTVYTALRAIDSLKILFAPFLPFSSERLHNYLGYKRPLFGDLSIQTFHESRNAHDALVYDGDDASGQWQPSQLVVGQRLEQPAPLFAKLDQSVVEQERQRLQQFTSV